MLLLELPVRHIVRSPTPWNTTEKSKPFQFSPPRVVASGKGILADKIIEKARESSVPIHRDDKLADTLSRLDIGEMIPPELYEVVAEILVFVDAVDHRMVKENVADGGKHKN